MDTYPADGRTLAAMCKDMGKSGPSVRSAGPSLVIENCGIDKAQSALFVVVLGCGSMIQFFRCGFKGFADKTYAVG